jgi:ATP-binding cassette subfamily B protein
VVFQGLAGHRRRLRYVMDTGSDPALANEVRVLGLRDWFTARGRREAGRYHAPLWRSRRRIYFGPFLALTAVVLGGATVVLVMLGAAAARGRLSVLDLSLAIQAILIPMRFGVFFPESDLQTQHGATAYEAITTFERRCAAAASPALGSLAADGLPLTAISLEDVHFAYPGSARPVLAGLDLRLEAGRSTAIVGLNGSGKTTLIKLLARLYEPTSGRIAVDGTDLRELDPEAWQRRLAVIFQDYIRYELDAAANIALGAPGHIGDLAAWRAAAQQAGAAGFIDALPSGPDTPLSSRYRGGTDLSGGQWQRIALARALFAVHAGATVLVLDEPTAQLDVRAEAMFFDRFLDLTAGLTTVLISHRFSTVRRADHIAVLSSGRIIEQGDHDRLMRQAGRYAELFRIQANRFQFHSGSAFRDAGAP